MAIVAGGWIDQPTTKVGGGYHAEHVIGFEEAGPGRSGPRRLTSVWICRTCCHSPAQRDFRRLLFASRGSGVTRMKTTALRRDSRLVAEG